MKRYSLYIICLFFSALLQTTQANAQKKQKQLIGKWFIKEFNLVFPKEQNDNSEEQKMFKQELEAQQKQLIGKELFELFADGTMKLQDEQGNTTKGTWKYDQATETLTTKEDNTEKAEEMKVVWKGKVPMITFEEKESDMGMKMVFGKK